EGHPARGRAAHRGERAMNVQPCRRSTHVRITIWIAALLVGASLGSRPAAAQLTWLQVPASCPPGTITPGHGETPQVVACGGLGSFVFGPPCLPYSAPNRRLGPRHHR